jgi:ubiquinone/menaquinone biosynthesis C-methylase UbiE
MPTPHDARTKAAITYNAAADRYDDPANSFWARFGQKTIQQLDLKPGEHLLDVCCGSGASAIPSAQIVGPGGSVIGVDLAEDLLKLARQKARDLKLHNIEFQQGDMLDLRFNDSQFDAVVCVFGIFFVPDMQAAVRELWRLVRPGGKLALTTWGPNFFEPASTVFWNSIREVRPDLYKGFNPWDRICDPVSLRDLFHQGGAELVNVHAEDGTHELASPEAWWAAILGSGYRGTIDQLDAAAVEHVRNINFNYIRDSGVRSVEANVVYGVAVKSEP